MLCSASTPAPRPTISEDSQAAGYLFGDAKRNSGAEDEAEDETGSGDEAVVVEVAVELSAASLAEHPTVIVALDTGPAHLNQDVDSRPPVVERHIDIEA